jgi:hypothetical protein
MCNFRAHNLEKFVDQSRQDKIGLCITHKRGEMTEAFWMQVEGVCPDLFIYFTTTEE